MNFKDKLSIILVFSFLLSGCSPLVRLQARVANAVSPGEVFKSSAYMAEDPNSPLIKLNMTKDEVKSLWGTPDKEMEYGITVGACDFIYEFPAGKKCGSKKQFNVYHSYVLSFASDKLAAITYCKICDKCEGMSGTFCVPSKVF